MSRLGQTTAIRSIPRLTSKSRFAAICSSGLSAMCSLRDILCIGAIFAIAFTPTASPAQEGRRCSFLVQGQHTDAGDCLYKEAAHYYEVVFRSKTYTLVTKTSSGQPKLFIDGVFTTIGSGNFSSSITEACGLFIALSEANEEFNRSIKNYVRGLCVSQ